MEKEFEMVTLEDGKEYVIIEEITENDVTYVYLTNVEDETDFCIRKVIDEQTGKMLIGLSDNNEFDKALLYFTKKNNV